MRVPDDDYLRTHHAHYIIYLLLENLSLGYLGYT